VKPQPIPDSLEMLGLAPGEVPAVRLTYRIGQPGLEEMLHRMLAVHNEVDAKVEEGVLTVVLK